MAYSKALAVAYATNRNQYKSSDGLLNNLLTKVGVKGKTILDFGCGDGPEAEKFILMKARKVVGIDPSSEMIKLAKKRKLQNATFIKSDGKLIPLKNDQFDVVYARFVLHYIKNLKPQFSEISRVLKGKGYFLTIFQCLTDNPKLLNKLIPLNLGRGSAVTKIKIFSKSVDEVRSVVKDANLKIIKFVEVKNTDSHIDSKYKNKRKFKNTTHVLLVQKV
jgi:ubiquinone/menaquinone biosynthesis C-methylase UbiE